MRYTSSQAGFEPLASPFDSFLEFHSMKNTFDITKVEPGKVIAERINGWAAMMGFWAAIGAYLTTGQIIPGIV